MSEDVAFRLAELERRLANTVRLGTVAEADYSTARVRVSIGALKTDWLPWVTRRAGGDITWWAPEVGEQVLVLAPYGELAQAVVVPALYSTAHPAPASHADIRHADFGDGARMSYDRAAHHLSIDLPGSATISINAVGGIVIDASTGNVVVSGDVIADGVSLVHHTHGGVVPGSGSTGEPN